MLWRGPGDAATDDELSLLIRGRSVVLNGQSLEIGHDCCQVRERRRFPGTRTARQPDEPGFAAFHERGDFVLEQQGFAADWRNHARADEGWLRFEHETVPAAQRPAWGERLSCKETLRGRR